MSEPTTIKTKPFISASKNLPEITFKAIILAVILAITLAAANAYLGLKVGLTVSASIPAAVISMSVLRLFRNSNILESNIVQTAASTGEALVAGVAYILPALIILHYWTHFDYWQTVIITMFGGFLGVMFSIPLRRVLLSHPTLRFPEGTAIGQVLKSSVEDKSSLKHLVRGGLVGGFISLAQTGFQVVADTLQIWFRTSSGLIYGFGSGFEPALIAAGYIIGINLAVSALFGAMIGWFCGIPVLSYLNPVAATSDLNTAAMMIWHDHTRYIGIGTLLVGAIWTFVTLIKPIIIGLRASFKSFDRSANKSDKKLPRTERDIPIKYATWGTFLSLIPIAFLLKGFVSNPALQLSLSIQILTILMALVLIVAIGFALSATSGYFAGLVGSTATPGSALILAGLVILSLLMLVFFNSFLHMGHDSTARLAAAALTIIIATAFGAANVITNETIQDLKAGQIVGATPWKQQVMLLVGVVAASVVLPFTLQLLYDAYGIAGALPRPNMDPTQVLAAPQANLMATIVQAIFTHTITWTMFAVGGIIAVISIFIDRYARTKGGNFPVLGVGLGIYLPFSATMSLVIGGFIAYFIEKAARARYKKQPAEAEHGLQRGLTLACGMVAGAALMGVILAIPFALSQSTDVLKLAPANFGPIAGGLILLITIGLVYWFYHTVCQKPRK